jgi:hypothetical protein
MEDLNSKYKIIYYTLESKLGTMRELIFRKDSRIIAPSNTK